MVKKIDIARALGVSAAAVTKHAKSGMPTNTIEEATRWHARNVDATRSLSQKLGRAERVDSLAATAARALAAVARLGELAQVDFARHESSLRQALRQVPREARDRVTLERDVWDRLVDPANLKRWDELLLRRGAAEGKPPVNLADPETTIFAVDVDDWLYRIASGERLVPQVSQADLDRA